MTTFRQQLQAELDDTTGAYNDDNGANIKVAGVRFSLAEYKRLTADITDAQLDSMISRKGYAPGFFTRKGLRVLAVFRDASQEEIFHQLLRGTSILLFLLMPLAALLLKGAYFQQHRHYVSHLIFTVHMHCFLFVFIALLLMLEKVNLPQILNGALALVPVVYFVVALHTFYQQKWSKTIFKSLMLSFAYSIVLVVAGLAVGFGGLLYI